jgi:hypothetical protein
MGHTVDQYIFRGWRRCRRFYWEFAFTLVTAFMMVMIVATWLDGTLETDLLWLSISIGLFVISLVIFWVALPSLHHLGALEKEVLIEKGMDHKTMKRILDRALTRDGICELHMIGPYRTTEDPPVVLMVSTNPRPTVDYVLLEVGSNLVMLELNYYTEEGRLDMIVPRRWVEMIPQYEGALLNLS